MFRALDCDEVRDIGAVGKAPERALNDPMELMGGRGMVPLAMASRSEDVVPGGRVRPPMGALKVPMLKAPPPAPREFTLGPGV